MNESAGPKDWPQTLVGALNIAFLEAQRIWASRQGKAQGRLYTFECGPRMRLGTMPQTALGTFSSNGKEASAGSLFTRDGDPFVTM